MTDQPSPWETFEEWRQGARAPGAFYEQLDAQGAWQLMRYVVKWAALLLGGLALWVGSREHAALLGVISLVFFVLDATYRNPWTTLHNRLGKDGHLVRCAFVMANAHWFDPANKDPMPGSVVATFDRGLAEDPDRLAELGRSLGQLKDLDRTKMTSSEGAVAWALHHELPCRRVKVPATIAGNDETYLYATYLWPDSFGEPDATTQQVEWGVALREETHPAGFGLPMPGTFDIE